MEKELIRERLQPGRLANGEVPHLPIGEPKHVLAARYAMITSLQRLSWLVQGAAGVTGIGSSSRVKFMIWHDSIRSLWIWQIGDHVADSCPWPIKGQKRPCPFDGGTKSIGYSWAAPCCKLVALPVLSRYPLIDQQCLLGVSTAREAPLDAKVGPERHYKNPFSSLRHAVIRRVEEIEYDVVFNLSYSLRRLVVMLRQGRDREYSVERYRGSVLPAADALKIVFEQLSADATPEFDAILQRVMEVETGIDAGPEDLIEPIGGVFKRMRVNAVGERMAIDHYMYLLRAEEVANQARYRTGSATMRRRIFRMIRRDAQRRPAGIGCQFGVRAAGLNGGNRPPEIKRILRIDAPNERIRQSRPQNGRQPGRIQHV